MHVKLLACDVEEGHCILYCIYSLDSTQIRKDFLRVLLADILRIYDRNTQGLLINYFHSTTVQYFDFKAFFFFSTV
jgi:hypothetical protein